MKTAFLFPGQASQKIGMGHDLFEGTELGRNYFKRANEIMGLDLQDIIFNGPDDKLKQTRFTQPAIYLVSVILGLLIVEKGLKPSFTAGHSLGEYCALTLAGAFDFETGLKLVKVRAEEMQKTGTAKRGTMAAIIGLEDDKVRDLCSAFKKGIVVAANFNAPGQVVISGEKTAVSEVMISAREAGAGKVIELKVSGAFHSPLMSPAREILAEKLNSIEIKDTYIPVFANVTAQPVSKTQDIRNVLINQLDNPVNWHASVSNIIKLGAKQALEVGPGRVLCGLSRRINPGFPMRSIGSLEDLEKVVNV
ncbi:MAG: ACP S-malonyltransferase [Candidatus Neomarinimicrobiota bacterium]